MANGGSCRIRIEEGGAVLRKGTWTAEEDEVLLEYVRRCSPRDWSSIRSKGLLPRTGKSCCLRWVNKLKPNLKSGCKFSEQEESIVINLQAQLGNKWARIATFLPGRTDNDVKNFWSSRQKRLARILQSSLPKAGKYQGMIPAASSHEATASSHEAAASKDPCVDLIMPEEFTAQGRHCSKTQLCKKQNNERELLAQVPDDGSYPFLLNLDAPPQRMHVLEPSPSLPQQPFADRLPQPRGYTIKPKAADDLPLHGGTSFPVEVARLEPLQCTQFHDELPFLGSGEGMLHVVKRDQNENPEMLIDAFFHEYALDYSWPWVPPPTSAPFGLAFWTAYGVAVSRNQEAEVFSPLASLFQPTNNCFKQG